jgi:hypothetical protein
MGTKDPERSEPSCLESGSTFNDNGAMLSVLSDDVRPQLAEALLVPIGFK